MNHNDGVSREWSDFKDVSSNCETFYFPVDKAMGPVIPPKPISALRQLPPLKPVHPPRPAVAILNRGEGSVSSGRGEGREHIVEYQ